MKKRQLGKTDLFVSEVGLGTWQMSGDVWGTKSEAEYIKAIHTALDTGITYFDTALEYGNGYSEQILGKALQGNTNVVISSKLPPQCDVWSPPPQSNIDEFFSPAWIKKCCEESLQNLKRDYIDILFLHTWNLAWGHCTAWYETMLELKEQGKIRAIGISVGDQRASEANVHIEAKRLDVIQVVYNVFEQAPEYTLFPMAQKHQVGIIARCPFSSGALVGNWQADQSFSDDDWRGQWPPQGWLTEQVTMANYVKPILESTQLPISIAALKYILMNESVTSVIPGSANLEHIQQNAMASQVPPLSKETFQQLKNLWLKGDIHGTYNGGADTL